MLIEKLKELGIKEVLENRERRNFVIKKAIRWGKHRCRKKKKERGFSNAGYG